MASNFPSFYKNPDLFRTLYKVAQDATDNGLKEKEMETARKVYFGLIREAEQDSHKHITRDMPEDLVDISGTDRKRIVTGVIPTPLAFPSGNKSKIIRMLIEGAGNLYSAYDDTNGEGGILFLTNVDPKENSDLLPCETVYLHTKYKISHS